jgi:hypothetical protein
MDIFEALKQGRTVEDLTEEFFEALALAQGEYDKYQARQAKVREAEAQRRLAREYELQRIKEAREALGAAMLSYFVALGKEATDKTYTDIDAIIDALPSIKVVQRWV